ncbi:MAG: hypothetical protein AAFU49_19340 [Pseudomonadota bacterium]
MTEKEQALEDLKLRAEIAHLNAQTAKLSKEIRWFEAIILFGVAGVAVAITRLLT